MITRNDLLTDKAEIETVLCALGGGIGGNPRQESYRGYHPRHLAHSGISLAEDVGPMTDTYKRFVKVFQAAAIADGLGYDEVAEIMNVHPNTIRNWWAFRSIMDGDAVLRAIRYMGGYKC